MSEAIYVEGLTKAYNGKTVVKHLNLSVKSGTVFGLLGANGAGKSTTIECMLGTKQADSGDEDSQTTACYAGQPGIHSVC